MGGTPYGHPEEAHHRLPKKIRQKDLFDFSIRGKTVVAIPRFTPNRRNAPQDHGASSLNGHPALSRLRVSHWAFFD
jgi:hypothetical protein